VNILLLNGYNEEIWNISNNDQDQVHICKLDKNVIQNPKFIEMMNHLISYTDD